MKTLAERLKLARINRGLTQTELAQKVGVSQNSITKIENGGNTTLITKLSSVLGVDPLWLSGDDATTNIGDNQIISGSTVTFNTANQINHGYDYGQISSLEQTVDHRHRIDYLDVRAAAGLSGFENSDYPETISSLYLTDEGVSRMIGRKSTAGICLINVPTDSMEPTIRKGDLVFLDTNINYYNGDGIYAFSIDGALFIKRIQKLFGGGYRLHSDNKDNYDPQDITEDMCAGAKFIGRFIKTIHI